MAQESRTSTQQVQARGNLDINIFSLHFYIRRNRSPSHVPLYKSCNYVQPNSLDFQVPTIIKRWLTKWINIDLEDGDILKDKSKS